MKQNKLVLGTAQLGLDYDIANKEGRPSEKEAFKIMKYAVEREIFYFDTAYSYGNSEIIIGKFLIFFKNYKNKINIITKMASLKSKRIGEKINEVLLTGEEAPHTKESENYFIIEPEHAFWDKDNFKEGKPLSFGFNYLSNGNNQWLNKEDLKKCWRSCNDSRISY